VRVMVRVRVTVRVRVRVRVKVRIRIRVRVGERGGACNRISRPSVVAPAPRLGLGFQK
jgi:hypothetical protein